MTYWLFKSEPTTFSIDDLIKSPHQTTNWNGVRNYQVRNMLRDAIKVSDSAFFYHSNCTPPGIVGMIKVVKAGYPDASAWDKNSNYFDPKSSPEKPVWYQVDVHFLKKFKNIITLDEIKKHPHLKNMLINRKGNRLSITPVSLEEWTTITAVVKPTT